MYVTILKAQIIPSTIDFDKVGNDSLWYVFANGTDNPKYCAVADNPSKSGINKSLKVGKLIVVGNAQPWAGIYSTTAIKPFILDERNCVIKIHVYKNVKSKFTLKFENKKTTWAHEIGVVNADTGKWEQLTFDFTEFVKDADTISRIVIIPDFPDTRTSGSINYFDNIDFGKGVVIASVNSSNYQFKIFPNPAVNMIKVTGNSGTSLKIFDITGNMVKSIILNEGENSIDISNLSKGLYIVQSRNYAKKLIVN